jgi:glycosyltransferase involved in cell wall biosynthesis
LHIALNLLPLVPSETGGSELYARRLVPALLNAGPALRLTVFTGHRAARSLRDEPWSNGVEVIDFRLDARSHIRRVLAEQTVLPRAVRHVRPDLLHNLFTTAPAVPSVPQVTTILDVIYKRFPETHGGLLARGLAILVWTAARCSERVVTLSEAAKNDIVHFLAVPADRVDVTHLGPSLPSIKGTPVAELRRGLELGEAPIILTVSAKRPHKNLERLLEAFAQVRAEPQPVLIVPGYATFHEEALRKRAAQAGVAELVRFTGWLDDRLLAGLYEAAACFVFPSLAEGFGLPVLDALVRGTPVACSNASSIPEVAGDAALYFDPTDTGAITAAIERLLEDAKLRERLRAAGRQQASKFSWSETAALTIQSYERALATARS